MVKLNLLIQEKALGICTKGLWREEMNQAFKQEPAVESLNNRRNTRLDGGDLTSGLGGMAGCQ